MSRLSVFLAIIAFFAPGLVAAAPPPYDWQTDFGKVDEALEACVRAQNCQEAFGDREVAWTGTLVSFDEEGSFAKIAMDGAARTLIVAGRQINLICCTFPVANPADWRSMATGTKVRFQATVSPLLPVMYLPGVIGVGLDFAALLPAEAPLQLRQRFAISGRVVDQSGAPAAGTYVHVSYQNNGYQFGDAGADGTFSFPLESRVSPPSSADFLAMYPNPIQRSTSSEKWYAFAADADVSQAVTLVLLPAGKAEVTVKNANGAPVDGVELHFVTVNGKTLGGGDAVTDASGQARLALPVGAIGVQASYLITRNGLRGARAKDRRGMYFPSRRDDVDVKSAVQVINVEAGSRQVLEISLPPTPTRTR